MMMGTPSSNFPSTVGDLPLNFNDPTFRKKKKKKESLLVVFNSILLNKSS